MKTFLKSWKKNRRRAQEEKETNLNRSGQEVKWEVHGWQQTKQHSNSQKNHSKINSEWKMLGLSNQNDSHWEGGEMEGEWTGNERWHTRPSSQGPLQQRASVCACVCPGPGGGPLYVPAGACLPLKACAALPGEAPAVCCVILSGACLGRPFPHSARCAVKHGVGGRRRGKEVKRPRSVNITWTWQPWHKPHTQTFSIISTLYITESLLRGSSPQSGIPCSPQDKLPSNQSVLSLFTESSFSPPWAFQFHIL